MNEIKLALLCDLIIKSVVMISITYCVIEFQDYSLMWWYLLVLFVGWDIKKTTKRGDNECQNK